MKWWYYEYLDHIDIFFQVGVVSDTLWRSGEPNNSGPDGRDENGVDLMLYQGSWGLNDEYMFNLVKYVCERPGKGFSYKK